MIRFLEKTAFNVERNLKNTVIAFRIYGVIFSFCAVVFGLYGILPLSKAITIKLAVSKEMQDRYKTMKINLENAKREAVSISENQSRITLLDRYMPQETNVQTYILDFIDSISLSGFALTNFSQQDVVDNENGQIDISLALEGVAYPTDMVKHIEVLKRVTQIKRVNVYQNNAGVFTINVVLTIYTLVT